MIDLDETEFRRRVEVAGEPFVVEFHAAWCPFGALLGPKLRRVEAAFGARWRVGRFDVVGAEAAAGALGVECVPAVAVYTAGVRRAVWFGDPPLPAVLSALEALS